MTSMKVWPTVKVTGWPFAPKRSVGAVGDALRHVPLIVTPLVEIQATPCPTLDASRRCLFGCPSLSGPKAILRMTTFFGATGRPSAASTWDLNGPPEEMKRRYVLVTAS